MKHTFLGPILGLAITFAAGNAAAQDALVSVRASSGSVSVNGTPLAEGQSVGAKAGDVVTVTDGTAVVTYSNGCTFGVTQAHTVGAQPPAVCPADAQAPRGKISGTAVGVGVGVAAAAAAASGGGGGGDDEPVPSSP